MWFVNIIRSRHSSTPKQTNSQPQRLAFFINYSKWRRERPDLRKWRDWFGIKLYEILWVQLCVDDVHLYADSWVYIRPATVEPTAACCTANGRGCGCGSCCWPPNPSCKASGKGTAAAAAAGTGAGDGVGTGGAGATCSQRVSIFFASSSRCSAIECIVFCSSSQSCATQFTFESALRKLNTRIY